jgi:hypothetical protein
VVRPRYDQQTWLVRTCPLVASGVELRTHGEQRRTTSGRKLGSVNGPGPESVERLKERGDVDALLALLRNADYFVVVAAAKTLAELNEQPRNAASN